MKKYLLTVFGDFDDEKCLEIAHCMEPLIDSEHLKFNYKSNVIIFHFASEILMCDIHEFMELLSPDYFDTFILSEWNETVSVMMTDEVKEHLFDLENDTSDAVTIPSNPNRIDSYYDEEDEDDMVTLLLKEVKKGLTTPSLDQLLDKISENGVDSLTPYEKGVLETYSQK